MRTKGRPTRGQISTSDESGEEGPSSRSQVEPVVGSLISIKLHGNSWWPAQVVDENGVSEINKPDGGLPGEVLVRLYGSYHAYADPNKCLPAFETVVQQDNGSYLDIYQRALEQDLPSSKSSGSKGGGSKRKGAAKTTTGASKGIRSNRRLAQRTLDLEDTTGSADATPKMKAKRNDSTSRKDTQGGTSDELAITGTLESSQGSSSRRSRTAAAKARARISHQANIEQDDGLQKESLPSKDQISDEETATPEDDEGQRSRRSGSPRANKRSKGKRPMQESTSKPDSKKPKLSSAKKEGKWEVPKLAESVKKEKPAQKLLIKPEELSTRRLRVMKTLGLIGPSGSPFHRNGQILALD